MVIIDEKRMLINTILGRSIILIRVNCSNFYLTKKIIKNFHCLYVMFLKVFSNDRENLLKNKHNQYIFLYLIILIHFFVFFQYPQ